MVDFVEDGGAVFVGAFTLGRNDVGGGVLEELLGYKRGCCFVALEGRGTAYLLVVVNG